MLLWLVSRLALVVVLYLLAWTITTVTGDPHLTDSPGRVLGMGIVFVVPFTAGVSGIAWILAAAVRWAPSIGRSVSRSILAALAVVEALAVATFLVFLLPGSTAAHAVTALVSGALAWLFVRVNHRAPVAMEPT